MTGIWSLLRSKEQSGRWNHHFKGALKSAIAGRQYTQSRCYAAGFATHKACLVCLHHLTAERCTGNGSAILPGPEPEAKYGKRKRRAKFDDSHLTATPPDDILARCPIGNNHHRAWTCPHTEDQRSRGVGDHIVAAALKMNGNDPLGDRGLYPLHNMAIPPRSTEATFTWILRPPGGILTSTIYTDGSRLDGLVALLAVNGWAFVAVDASGTVTAIARGVPPPWIDDIPGAEAWALLQAAQRRTPDVPIRVDCEPCVNAVHRGMKRATADSRKHARVNALLLTALDDTPAEMVAQERRHERRGAGQLR